MLAEPGWVIPAGRYERRYAAFAVSTSKRGNKAYFEALNRQMAEGGIEAMFYDLREMELGNWHPRNIPDAVLNGTALQRQQSHNLPPLEQWYVMLLHSGVLPLALPKRPSTTYTQALINDAKRKIPRLRELTEVQLRNFLIDEESIGVACEKFRSNAGNGWTFPPLAEARDAWARRYGPVRWDNPAEHWGEKVKPVHIAGPPGP
jgi:Mesyanzhinovviridae DNA primase